MGDDDVGRIGNVRLGIEEVEVLLTRLDNCLVNGDLLGKDRIESAARTNAEQSISERDLRRISASTRSTDLPLVAIA